MKVERIPMIMIIIHVFATSLGIWIWYLENERLPSLILHCIFSVIYINLVALYMEFHGFAGSLKFERRI